MSCARRCVSSGSMWARRRPPPSCSGTTLTTTGCSTCASSAPSCVSWGGHPVRSTSTPSWPAPRGRRRRATTAGSTSTTTRRASRPGSGPPRSMPSRAPPRARRPVAPLTNHRSRPLRCHAPRPSPYPAPCTRAAHACVAPCHAPHATHHTTRPMPRAPCHAPHHAPHATRPMPRTTPRAMWPRHVPRANALQHTRSRCSSPTHTHNAQRTQVLLAVNSVTEVGRQRALAVSGLEMDGTHGAPRSVGGRSGGR